MEKNKQASEPVGVDGWYFRQVSDDELTHKEKRLIGNGYPGGKTKKPPREIIGSFFGVLICKMKDKRG